MKSKIKSHQFKTMPWKNGQGVTSEIYIYPEDADFAKSDFYWRISSAKIQAQNTFSNFPGYQRLLTVLKGEGLILNNKKLLPNEIYKFSGDEKIECKLIENEVEDLGIIFDPKRSNCKMKILKFNKKTILELNSEIHFLKPLSENLLFDGESVEDDIFVKIQKEKNIEIDAQIFPAEVLQISCNLKEDAS